VSFIGFLTKYKRQRSWLIETCGERLPEVINKVIQDGIMKKKMMIAILAVSSALPMTQAFAAAGTVNFNGNILDSACDVDVASQNQVVVLGDYYKTEFPVPEREPQQQIRYCIEKLSGDG
jgi:hypothetical protein